MIRVTVAAKVNLALLVGPPRPDGYHDVATLMQRIDLADTLQLELAATREVAGFADDTLVARALDLLAAASGEPLPVRVSIRKGIPVAAGLGGGSADAAAALVAANGLLRTPLPPVELFPLAATLGSDVPFFLEPGPKLAEGRGELLTPADLPQDYWVVVALPHGVAKASTAAVYGRFDAAGGGERFEERRAALLDLLPGLRRARHLAVLPPNDLAAASGAAGFAERLTAMGAFRADVSGAGPSVYGLFIHRHLADRAAAALRGVARVWVAPAVW